MRTWKEIKNKALRTLFVLMYDVMDHNSCVLAFHFAIAENMYRLNMAIPKHWVYKPGLSAIQGGKPTEEPDLMIWQLLGNGVEEHDLIQAGNIMESSVLID